ncbi:MAG: shikimate dehydrogenase [Thermoleophilia bacterium]
MNGGRQDITAATGLVVLLGHPVGHSRSPLMHNAAFEQTGIDLVYLAFDVHPEDLARAIGAFRALGWAGANLTIPHKETVIPLLDSLDPLAEQVGAVNTIVVREKKLIGHNTDVSGFLEGLESGWGRSARGASALVLGAGGAARAVLAALQAAEAAEMYVYNRTEERAVRLCKEAAEWGGAQCRAVTHEEASSLVSRVNLLVNATPLGLKDNIKLPPLPVDKLTEGQVVMDLVYGPTATPLVEFARRRGAIAIDGTEMLVRQAARAFELWTGAPAPVDLMRERATA